MNWKEELEAAVREQRLPTPVRLIRDVVNVQMGADYPARAIYDRIHATDDLRWVIDPAYQRGPVWTREQQASFLGAWQCGGFIPPIVLWELPDCYSVLDGQQRCRAIVDWIDGKVDAWLPVFQQHLSWTTFAGTRRWVGETLKTAGFKGTRREAMRLYVNLNTTGVPHSKDDIERALAYGAQEDE